MAKTLSFKWISFITDSEELAGGYASDKLVTGYIHTKADLPQLSEAVRATEKLEGVAVSLGDYFGKVFVNKVTTPIQLETHLDISADRNLYTISGEGPTLQWLLEHIEEVNNPDPSKLHYFSDMVVQFLPQEYDKDRVTIKVLNLEGVRNFAYEIQDTDVSWLPGSFEEFIREYGYVDISVYKELSYILIVFKAAKSLWFNDPIEVATHFGDKRLVADLTLKGVFEEVGK